MQGYKWKVISKYYDNTGLVNMQRINASPAISIETQILILLQHVHLNETMLCAGNCAKIVVIIY